MINITEISPPLKLSGRSSFLISFNYDQEIVEAVKLLPNAIYHKKTHNWEIPVTELSKALDSLTFKDDITLSVIEAPQKNIFSQPPLSSEEIEQFKIKPFEHQLTAINYMLTHPKSLLLDAPGLGKTNEVIWFAETLKRRGIIDHCFIVCGINAVKQNWKKEIAKFSTESCRVLGERVTRTGSIRYDTIANRAAELLAGVKEFFLITNIETLRDDKIIEAIQKSKSSFGLIAVDEIHKCLTGDMIVETDLGQMSLYDMNTLSSLPKVLSHNVSTGRDEFKQILNIIVSDPTENILELEFSENGKTYIVKCTESHKIYTINRGWIKAKDLTFEDNIKIY